MSSSRLVAPAHKCVSRESTESACRFCTLCGVHMSSAKNGPVYHRAEQYRLVDLYRLDANIILRQMVAKQAVNRHYSPRAKYIKSRAELLDFLEYLAEKLEYSQTTYYLGVAVLDAVLSQFAVHRKQIKLICFMSLQLAAKMEESNSRVPEVSTVRSLFHDKYDDEEINSCEEMISVMLNHSFGIKTPFSFVEHFLSKGVVSSNDIGNVSAKAVTDRVNSYERAVVRFLDVSVYDYGFYAYNALTVAAASLLCARRLEKFECEWPEELAKLTGVSYENVKKCADQLFDRFKQMNSKASSIDPTSNNKTSSPTGLSLTKTSSVDTIESLSSNKKQSDKIAAFDAVDEKPVKNSVKYMPSITQF